MLTVNLDKARHDLGTSAGGRTDYRVFTCLAEYMDGNGVSTVPQTVIAKETGYTRRTVSNSVRRLQDKSFLTIEKTVEDSKGVTRGIACNIYHINPQHLMETEDAKPASVSECSACMKPCSAANDVQRLARLSEVLNDVVHELLNLYEEKNK